LGQAASNRHIQPKENQMHPSSITTPLPSPTLSTTEQTWTGHISDSECGATHHRLTPNSRHKLSARECTLACVHDGAEFVFVSLGVIYRVTNQDFPTLPEHAGHTVDLTGVRTGDSIHVTNIVMPVTAGKMVAIFGVYYDKAQATASVESITDSGFPADEVSILAPETLGFKDLAHDRHAKAGSSTAVVTSSVAIGGTLGLVAGVGALAIPGIGPLLAAGPLLGALAGMGAGGVVGGAIDAIDAAGPAVHAAKVYEGHIREGGILVSVNCRSADEIARAKELLARTGAQAISSSDEYAAGRNASAPSDEST
jgi:hypothetical protein